jgi:hypothetical protein
MISEVGEEATIWLLAPDDSFGEESLAPVPGFRL